MIVLVYDTKKRNPKPIPVGESRAQKLLASGRYKLWEENLSEVEIVKPKKKEVVVEAKPERIVKTTNPRTGNELTIDTQEGKIIKTTKSEPTTDTQYDKVIKTKKSKKKV